MLKLTDTEFRLFKNLVYEKSGIDIKENRRDFLAGRLSNRMRVAGITSPYWYYKLVSEGNDVELARLLDLMTINETSFFRNKYQIELFADMILPGIINKKEQAMERTLRIWSAGCSTGEEPYTLAMVVREAFERSGLWEWDIKIFASDLSLTALDTAAKGEYPSSKIIDVVDGYYISKYFDHTGDSYRIKNEVKKFVIFDYHNLKNDNGLRTIDIIFCRNVMIYFDADEQKKLIDTFYRCLNPGGYLFIGHTESLHGMHGGFEFIFHNDGATYKKNGRALPV